MYGSAQVTVATRSTPSVPGSATAAAFRATSSPAPNAPGMAPGVADVPGEAAGVDPGDARDAVPAQVGVEVVGRAPVRSPPGQVADDDAPGERPPALVVVGVDPVVADVRVGEGDDLARVAGVGQHLLVARQHRVEHDLAAGDARGGLGADELALERRAVGQDEHALADRHRRRPCWSTRSCDGTCDVTVAPACRSVAGTEGVPGDRIRMQPSEWRGPFLNAGPRRR